MRTAIYTQVSTTDQNPEMQIRELKEYATNHGSEILEIYDDTISGSKLSRPALNRLMDDARARELNCLVVHYRTRSCRQLAKAIAFWC